MLMRLTDEGKLEIDKPVESYIPAFSINQRFPQSSPITIRSMLTHHSGLPTDIFMGGFTANKADPLWLDWLTGYLKDEYTANPVGYSFAYSNTAFVLLHKVMESASGQPFYSYTDAMFDLLGMKDTTFGSRALPPERVSKAYVLGQEQPYLYANISTAGSVRSTVKDMARYMSTVLLAQGGSFIKPATMGEIFRDQTTGNAADDTWKHGLCFFLSDPALDYAGRIAWHNGATVDQTAHMEIMLDQGLGVVVLTNSITGIGMAGEAAKKALQLALEAKKGIKPSEPAPCPDSNSATPPSGLVDTIIGVYVGEGSPIFISAGESGTLKTSIDGNETQLGYLENGRWKKAGGSSQIEFRKVGDDTIMFVWDNATNSLRAGKLFRPAEITPAWLARLGDWEIINLPADDEANFVIKEVALVSKTASFRVEKGALVMDGALRKNMTLYPQSDTLAFTAGVGRNRGESVRILMEDGHEVVLMSGAKYKKKA
jgi:hypothetical protein